MQTVVHQLHNQVELLKVIDSPTGSKGVQEADDVGVADAGQEAELPVCQFGYPLLATRSVHLLYGHRPLSHLVVATPKWGLFEPGTTHTTEPCAPDARYCSFV